MIRVACPECSAEYSFADDQAGKGYTCKKCQVRFRIPAEDKKTAKAPPPVEKRPAPVPPPPVPAAKASPPPPPPPTPAKQTVAVPAAREDGYIDINPCPKCGVKLFVEPADVDTEIECPDCSKIFLAEEAGTSSRDKTPQKQRRRSEELEDEDVDRDSDSTERDEEPRPKKRPPKKRRKLRDEDDDVDEKENRDDRDDRDDDDDLDEPRKRRPKKKIKRSQLQKIVVGTGIAMTCVGGLGIVLVVIYAISVLLAVGSAVSNPNASGAAGAICGAIVAVGIMATVSVQIFRSGSNFYSQADHHNAMIGAVLCMIPCHAAFLIGLPVGILSLILLMRKDVKKLFG